ncbi:MAG: carboxypeptidase regulatory-like domain-containing protein [Blastocatellia bacterium]
MNANSIRRRLAHAFILLALFSSLASGAAPALAQQSVTAAALTGRVEDKDAAVIIGATVVVTYLDRNQSWTAKSDEQGRFRFAYLPVGKYHIKVERRGFTPSDQEVTLLVGQAIDLSIRLGVGEIIDVVTVAENAARVEASRTEVAGVVTPQEVDRLPLNGRNYLDLALLVPGVSRTNTGSNQRFAETSAVPGTGLSIAGQRNLYNSFIVDGLSANDDAADLTGAYFSQEVIREFQVITSGGVAEFGRASGGIVNIITQSGTRDWHGHLYGFLRNQRFDARNPLAPRKDELTQAQYGVSLGGPLQRDRTFWFANFEQTRRNDALIVTITPANIAAINRRLDQLFYGGPRLETGIVSSGFDATNFFTRVDYHPNASNQLAARYSLYDISAINSRTVGGLNTVSRGTALEDNDQTMALNHVMTVTPTSINEARFQYTRSRLSAPVNDAIGPAVNIAGVASFGTATSSPLARDIDLVETADTFAHIRGNHVIKAGGDWLYNRVDLLFPGATQGVYAFTSLTNFLSGAYGSYQQAFGAPSQFQSNPNVGLFIQDEWRARRGLTINAGLRYDAQFLPDPIRTDKNNFAPRLGLAYAPGDRRTVIRASFGLYFDRIPLRATSNALQRDGSRYVVVQLAPTQAGAPVFPNVLGAQPATLVTKPNVTRIDPNIESSYSQQASLQIERQLTSGAALSVGYVHLRGLHLILSRNLNVPRFPASAGVANLGRPDPDFGNISRYESSGDSYYDGLVVAFNQRATRWASFRVSYTLSKTIDNAGNFFFSTPQSNFDLRDDRGLSDNDQRHRLTVSGVFEAPRARSESKLRRAFAGLQLNTIFTYASALPFNIQTGTDRNFDTNFNDRPVGVGRNAGRGFDYASLDLRVARTFRFTDRFSVEALAESFNTLNRANWQLPNNIYGAGVAPLSSFGKPTAASDPRQIQFGLRVMF